MTRSATSAKPSPVRAGSLILAMAARSSFPVLAPTWRPTTCLQGPAWWTSAPTGCVTSPALEQVYQLAHPDIRSDFPPLRSLDRHAHNLAVQLTSFVGRSGRSLRCPAPVRPRPGHPHRLGRVRQDPLGAAGSR